MIDTDERSMDRATRQELTELRGAISRLQRELSQLKMGGATEVRARSFAVVDEQAKVRAEIDAQGFKILDAHGRQRAGLLVADGTVLLSLTDAEGTTRAALTVFADGTPELVFADASGSVLWHAP